MASNLPGYLPSRSEIDDRAECLRWMTLFEWDQTVIDGIMYFDHPSILVVRRLVYRHGPDMAYQIIREFGVSDECS